MNYQDALHYLNTRLPAFERDGVVSYKPGLERIRAFCDAISNPQQRYPIVHVAGTNGKGSTSAMLAAILQSAGYKTGLHVSPHLKSFTERARVNGVIAEERHLLDFLTQRKTLIEEYELSYFEFGTAWMLQYFADQNVDVAIIETGMGGTFDATNIVDSILSIITNISADHLRVLGPTLQDVAAAKAGIIKQNIPVVISQFQPEFAELFKAVASQKNAPIFFAQQSINAVNYECQLQGDYQRHNLPGVLQAIDLLRDKLTISDTAVREGLKNVCTLTGFKGRWQILHKDPLTIADGAHNKAGLEEVSQQLAQLPHKNLYAILGCTKEKNPAELMAHFPPETILIFAQASIPRAMPAEELYNAAQQSGRTAHLVANVNDAYALARQLAQTDDLIFIGGSLYLLGELNAL